MSVFFGFLIKRIYLTIALSAISLSLSAQNLANDSLNFVNANWNIQKIQGGIKAKTVHLNTCEIFNGNQHISIIEISPKNKYKFDLAYQAKALITLDSVIREKHAFAGINGTFFDIKNGGSVDFIESNDSVINQNNINKSGLRAEHQKGAILISNHKLSLAQWNGDEHWENNLIASDIMVSGPVLRMNNDNSILAKNIFNAERAPRSVIGIKADGTTLLVAIDGRMIEAEGVTIEETQTLMKWLNCTEAINLDGGGSTTLYLKNASENGIINHPSDNKIFDHFGQRKIANAIILIKK
jgi:exopolysaccharide biosynthesis protein